MRRELAPQNIVKLRGLDPERMYKNDFTGEVLSGALLMNAGIIIDGLAREDGSSDAIMFTAV